LIAGVIFSGELCQLAGKQLTSMFENLFKFFIAITSRAIAPQVINKVFDVFTFLTMFVCISPSPVKKPLPICGLTY
jgi:hypothetical protein